MNRGGNYHEYKLSQIYLPAFLNPAPGINWTEELVELATQTMAQVAKLDEYFRSTPSVEPAKSMLMMMETLASCYSTYQMCSLDDLLIRQIDPSNDDHHIESEEPYLESLGALFNQSNRRLSLDKLKKLHKDLTSHERKHIGGEFRRTNLTLKRPDSTSFFPPPPHEMIESLNDLEIFLSSTNMSTLAQIALTHFQLVAIHPFLDGNGRTTRAWTICMLMHHNLIQAPILPLSHFLFKNRKEYFKRIDVFKNDDDLEGWLSFFFNVLKTAAEKTFLTLKKIKNMFAVDEELVQGIPNGRKTLEILKSTPIIKTQILANRLSCSFLTAQRVITEMETAGFLREITGNKRNRIYEYGHYLDYWRSLIDDKDPDQIKLEAGGQERKYWTNSVKYSLEQLRQYIRGAGLLEKDWSVFEHEASLSGLFSIDPIDLKITFSKTDGISDLEMMPAERYTSNYSGSSPYIYIEVSIDEKPQRSWGFLLDVDQQSVKWDALFDGFPEAVPISEVARFVLKHFFEITTSKGIGTAKDSNRQQELDGKAKLLEMFLAIRNVLGKQTEGDIYWEDDNRGSDLVFHYDGVRHLLYFSLMEIVGVTINDSVEQRLRERMVENIRTLPSPPPR